MSKFVILFLIACVGLNIYFWNSNLLIRRSNNLSYSEGYNSGYKEGHDIGYSKGVEEGVGHGYNMRDPTYFEVLKFIEQDTTDLLPYIKDQFVCHDYVKNFKNNAFKLGFRCYYVCVYLEGGLHTITAFNTTDRGFVFIEPQSDDIVDLKVGEQYNQLIKGSIRLLGNDLILNFDYMF